MPPGSVSRYVRFLIIQGLRIFETISNRRKESVRGYGSWKCKEAVSPVLSHMKSVDQLLNGWSARQIQVDGSLLSKDTPPMARQTIAATVEKVTDDRASAIEEVRRDYQKAHRMYAGP